MHKNILLLMKIVNPQKKDAESFIMGPTKKTHKICMFDFPILCTFPYSIAFSWSSQASTLLPTHLIFPEPKLYAML